MVYGSVCDFQPVLTQSTQDLAANGKDTAERRRGRRNLRYLIRKYPSTAKKAKAKLP